MSDSKIVVTHNFARISAMLTHLADKKAIQRAVARSIKRTLPSVQRAAFSEIRAKKLLKLGAAQTKKRVRSYAEIGAAKPVAEQYGKIWITSQAESLGRFYARRVYAGRSTTVMGQDKYGGWKGVKLYSVKVNSYGAGAIKDPKRTFLVSHGGGSVVFARMAGSKRLPVEKLKGPGMAELVRNTGIYQRLAQVAERRYATEFEVNAKFYAEQAIQRAKRGK
jgi:hypothetical protein